jgi:hypothetical protein
MFEFKLSLGYAGNNSTTHSYKVKKDKCKREMIEEEMGEA